MHSLHHCQVAVIDLVCFAGVCLMLLISCRTCSVVGWIHLSLRSASGEELDEIMMTSSWWCDTNFQYKILLGLFAVLKGSVMLRQMQHMISNTNCKLARPLLFRYILQFASDCLVLPGMLGTNCTGQNSE